MSRLNCSLNLCGGISIELAWHLNMPVLDFHSYKIREVFDDFFLCSYQKM